MSVEPDSPVVIRLSTPTDRLFPLELRVQPGTEVVLGRGLGTQLPDALGVLGVSRRHASVGVERDRRAWIRDDGSRVGTWINDVLVETGRKTLIHGGDMIALGHFTFCVEFVSNGAPDD